MRDPNQITGAFARTCRIHVPGFFAPKPNYLCLPDDCGWRAKKKEHAGESSCHTATDHGRCFADDHVPAKHRLAVEAASSAVLAMLTEPPLRLPKLVSPFHFIHCDENSFRMVAKGFAATSFYNFAAKTFTFALPMTTIFPASHLSTEGA
jgi:hypothetical protein